MSGWTCPTCKTEHKDGDYPDHWSEGASSFEFECACGTTFEVDVDWSPHFTVLPSTVRHKEPQP